MIKSTQNLNGVNVEGIDVDAETRCTHYHTKKDIIAIKFNCCQTYYPCFQCHAELADHPATVWKKEDHNEKAVLCGACGTEMSINDYLQSKQVCPYCQADFNPGCKLDYPRYFEVD